MSKYHKWQHSAVATTEVYGSAPSVAAIRRVWAEVTRTPCAPSFMLARRARISRTSLYAALHILRDAGYIFYTAETQLARRVDVPLYVDRRIRRVRRLAGAA